MKRSIDIALAALGLVASAPALLLAAMLIRVTSCGPVFFEQERVGLHGKPFLIKKFRTMRVDNVGLAVTADADPRITRVGRWLRATKVDELPQLLNVLRGEMSLVGPRPEVAKYVAMWPADAREEILSVRPGITDPASIEFRRESELLAEAYDPEACYINEILPRKVALYRRYVASRSLRGDLRILIATTSAVARG